MIWTLIKLEQYGKQLQKFSEQVDNTILFIYLFKHSNHQNKNDKENFK